MKNIKIKELKNGQVLFGKGESGEFHDFKCWGDPTFVNGVWTIDCTDSGDYCYTFTEEDEGVLFEAEYEDRTFRSGKKYKIAVAPKESV